MLQHIMQKKINGKERKRTKNANTLLKVNKSLPFHPFVWSGLNTHAHNAVLLFWGENENYMLLFMLRDTYMPMYVRKFFVLSFFASLLLIVLWTLSSAVLRYLYLVFCLANKRTHRGFVCDVIFLCFMLFIFM
jgi:hypothetical protein